jgi:hypothetical protein
VKEDEQISAGAWQWNGVTDIRTGTFTESQLSSFRGKCYASNIPLNNCITIWQDKETAVLTNECACLMGGKSRRKLLGRDIELRQGIYLTYPSVDGYYM